MKAIILAAGMGIRLHDEEHPKCLTQLADSKTILDRQLALLLQHLSIHDIIIVVGHLKEQIMDIYPSLLYVYNADYRKENTSKSLLKALRKVDDDVIWLNGDVVFHPIVLELVFNNLQTSMVVNQGIVGEEEVKYRLNPEGMICEISKTVKNGEGEALGINYFTKEDAVKLQQHLEKCAPQDYFEKAIESCIQDGLRVRPILIDRNACAEIDFEEDILHANKLLSGWSLHEDTF